MFRRQASCRRRGISCGQVEIQQAAAGNDDGPLNNVPQFPNVAGSVVILKPNDARAGQPRRRAAQLSYRQVNEMFGQQRDVFHTFLQRHNMDRKDIQPVIKSFAKAPGGYFLLQVTIGRANASHIGLPGPSSPTRS